MVRIPYDANSSKIKYTIGQGTRFILGNPIQAWQCIGIDSVSGVRNTVDSSTDTNGFVELRLKLVAIDNVRDDLINFIAWQNYFG